MACSLASWKAYKFGLLIDFIGLGPSLYPMLTYILLSPLLLCNRMLLLFPLMKNGKWLFVPFIMPSLASFSAFLVAI